MNGLYEVLDEEGGGCPGDDWCLKRDTAVQSSDLRLGFKTTSVTDTKADLAAFTGEPFHPDDFDGSVEVSSNRSLFAISDEEETNGQHQTFSPFER